MKTFCLNLNDVTYKLLEKAYGDKKATVILTIIPTFNLADKFADRKLDNISVDEIVEVVFRELATLEEVHEELLANSNADLIKRYEPSFHVAEHIKQWFGIDIYTDSPNDEVEISYEEMIEYIKMVYPQSMTQLPLLQMLQEHVSIHATEEVKRSKRPFKIVLARAEKHTDPADGFVTAHIVGTNTIRLFYDRSSHPQYSPNVTEFGRNLLVNLNHEIAHALTLQSYWHDKDFEIEIRRLLEVARSHMDQQAIQENFYGLTNGEEFISEALTNIKFQTFLASIPYKSGKKPISVWKTFINLLRDYFNRVYGKNMIDGSLLEASITSIGHRIETVRSASKGVHTIFGIKMPTFSTQETPSYNIPTTQESIYQSNKLAIAAYGVEKFTVQKMGSEQTVEVNPAYLNAEKSLPVYKLSEQEGRLRQLDKARTFLERRFGKDTAIDIFNDTVRVGDDIAHGWFDSAGIHLWESSMQGTEYHEAFHAAFRLYNTDKNQQALLKEARSVYGENLSDIELEEKMADDFMDYVESRRDRPFLGKIMDFIKDLFNYLSSYFQSQSQIKDIYSQIYSGMINKSFKRSVGSLDNTKVYKRVQGFTKEQTTQIIDVSGRLFIKEKQNKNVPRTKLFNNVKDWFILNAFNINGKPLSKDRLDKENFVDLKKFVPLVTTYWSAAEELDLYTEGTQEYDIAEKIFNEADLQLGAFMQSKNINPISATGPTEEQRANNTDIFVKIYNSWDTIRDKPTGNDLSIGFDELLSDYLRNFGIEMVNKKTVEDDTDTNVDIAEMEQSIEKIYNMSQLKEDLRDKLSTEVKEFLRLIEIEDVNFLGFKKLIDFEDIYLDIALSLVQNNSAGIDVGGFQGMINALYEAGKTKPYLTTVADKLVDREKEKDGANFGAKFYTSFNNVYHRFLTVVNEFEDVYLTKAAADGKPTDQAKRELNIKIIETNRNSLAKKLIKDYESNSIETKDKPNPNAIMVENLDGALTVRRDKVLKAVELYNTFYNINDKTTTLEQKAKALSEFLNLFGATISADHIIKYLHKGVIDVVRENKKSRNVVVKDEDLLQRLIFGNKEKKETGLFTMLTHFASLTESREGVKIVKDSNENSKIHEEVSNLYSNYSKVFERFTSIEAVFAIADTGTFTDSMGKPIYPINLPTALSEYFAELKRGVINPDYYRDKSFVPDEENENSIARKSIFISWFENEAIRDGMEVFDFDAYKERGDALAKHDFDNLSDNTSLLVRTNMFLNNGENFGMFALPTLGDRARMQFIKLPRLSKLNEFGLNTDLNRVIEGYIYQDLEAIWQANKDILPVEQGGLADNQLIEGYHYAKGSTNKRDKSGNAFRFWNLSTIEVNTPLYSTYEHNDVDATSTSVEKKIITLNSTKEEFLAADKTVRDSVIQTLKDKYINEHIEAMTTKLLQDLINYKVVEGFFNSDGKFVGYKVGANNKKTVVSGMEFTHSLNKDALRKLYKADQGLSANEVMRNFAKDFIINDIIVRNEVTKITRGRRGFAKNYEDFNKRFGAVLTPGFKLAQKGSFPSHTEWGMPEYFKEACIFDVYNDYDQADALIESMKSLLPSDKLSHTKKYARGKVNKTDAFGVVTLDFGRSLLQGQGQWTDSHEEAYINYNKGKEFKDNKGHAPALMPIKAYYDGMVYQNDRMVPVMIKNSYQILIRDYTKDHPQLQELLDKMEDRAGNGKNKIDAVNTVTTRKLERHGMADITTKDYSLVASTLPTKYFRIPQVIPNKHDKPLIGSQYRKEILSNLMLDEDYSHEDFGRDVTGKDVFDAVGNVMDTMIQQDYNELMDELGFNNVQNLEREYNSNLNTQTEKEELNIKRKAAQRIFLRKLRKKIKESVQDRDLSENYTEALKIIYDNLNDTYRYQVSLSFPAYGKKFNQILFSIFRNKVMQQRTKGFSAVQIAELGGWGFTSSVPAETGEPVKPVKKKRVIEPSTFTFNDGITINTDFELNDQQKTALNKMDEFLNDPSESTFSLQGYAGTGKTSIVKYLLAHHRTARREKRLMQNNVVFSSPTNRANAVLRQNLHDEQVYTLHKVFGLSPDMSIEEFSTRNLKMIQQKSETLHRGDLLIIDESSMINDELFSFVLKSVKDKGVKVIFMGDKAQLKPVKKHTVSKVFTDITNTYELTKVERTADNPLLEEVTNIRNSKNPLEQLSLQTAVNEDNEGVTYTNSKSGLFDKAAELFNDPELKNNPLLARVLAYTNSSVTALNKFIQQNKFGNKEGVDYYVGDIIMGYSNYSVDRDTQEPKIINGGDYTVLKVSDKKHTVYEGIACDYFEITIKDAIDKKKPALTVRVLSKDNPKEVFNAFGKEFERKLAIAHAAPKGSREYGARFAEFYAFKDAFATPYDCTYGLNSSTGEPLVKIPKTFDLGYAHTIHKSQGGTYKYVLIDSTDIEKARDAELEKQLKYVALSRAQEHAYVLTNKELKEPRVIEAAPEKTPEIKHDEKVLNKPTGPEYLGFIKGKNGEVVAAECAVKWDIAEKFGLSAGQPLENIPEELRRLIGYRIPTQGKNSMLPLVIKYVLPDNYEHAILVPGEITTQMGSDFDVDKLFVMSPNLHIEGLNKSVNRYLSENGVEDIDAFWTEDLKEFRDMYKNTGHKPDRDLTGDELAIVEGITKFYESVKELDAKTYVTKIKPDWNDIFNGNTANMSREELENALFDLSWSILTNPKHFADLIEPRDDDRLPDLAKYYKTNGYFGDEANLDFNYPLTEQILEMRNKAGSKGIGIYANFLSGHNISQYTDIKFPEAINIRYNGKVDVLNSLHRTLDMDNNLIATNISAHLGIAVDNAKDPHMYFLNDNAVTSNITGLLLSLGVPIEGAAWFRMNPMIREFVKIAQLKNATPFEYGEIRDELYKKYGISDMLVYEARKNTKGGKDIKLDINTKTPVDKTVTKENALQQAILLDTFFDLNSMGTKLLRLNKILMADRISDMSSLGAIQNYEDVIKSVEDLLDTDTLMTDYPITYAFLEKGIRGAKEFFTASGLFLNTLTPNNVEILKGSIGRDVVDSKVYDMFHKELLFDTFQLFPENHHIFTEEKFNELFNGKDNLVAKWDSLKKRVPKLVYNKFFNNFYTRYDKKTDYQILHFNSSLRLTGDQRNVFVDNFKDMLYAPEIYTDDLALQVEIANFAQNLIYANLWRFGFDTTSSSITDIIPMEWFASKTYFRMLHSMQNVMGLVETGRVDSFMDNLVLNNVTTESFLRGVKVNDKSVIAIKDKNGKATNQIGVLPSTAISASAKDILTTYFKVFNKDTKEFDVYKTAGDTLDVLNTTKKNQDGTQVFETYVTYTKMEKKGIPYKFKEFNVFTESDGTLTKSIIKQEKGVAVDNYTTLTESSEQTVASVAVKETQPLGDIVDFLRNLEREDKATMLDTVRHPKTKIECE